ncbi:hypothetical protein [Pseudomonas sp. RL_15y_Pfl2_60]|uniref:hypothetical protein n=1 Tax=Pseudomonas sp. RL_15y_Pfl2_60 TaxID=3088709 RepID=UPI0030D87E74
MRAELEDRSSYLIKRPKKKRTLNIILCIATIGISIYFIALRQSGWGITIDVSKLLDAVTLNEELLQDKEIRKNRIKYNHLESKPTDHPINIKKPNNTEHKTMLRPNNWEVSLAKFNEIFINHPACDPKNMTWSQMECSNFHARAMKRFQKEWAKNSYWDGKKIIKNKKADIEVNAELSL